MCIRGFPWGQTCEREVGEAGWAECICDAGLARQPPLAPWGALARQDVSSHTGPRFPVPYALICCCMQTALGGKGGTLGGGDSVAEAEAVSEEAGSEGCTLDSWDQKSFLVTFSTSHHLQVVRNLGFLIPT